MLLIAGMVLACYLLGSVPSDSLIAKYLNCASVNNDFSETENSSYYSRYGLKAFCAAAAADALKGFLAVSLSYLLFVPGFLSPIFKALFALAAVLGCCFPVFSKFKGCRGAAAAFGAFFAVSFQAASIALMLWLAIMLITRWESAAAVSAFFSLPFILYSCGSSMWISLWAVCALIIFMYRRNIGLLMSGKEKRIKIKFF